MTTESKYKYAINLLIHCFCITMLAERIYAVTKSILEGVNVFAGDFSIVIYFTVFISIVGFLIHLFTFNRTSLKAIFVPSEIEKVDFKRLVTDGGILLLSGMADVKCKVVWWEYVAYSFFTVALLLQVIRNNKNSKNRLLLWLSGAYIAFFAYGTPVTYKSDLDYHVILHILEFSASYLMVAGVTYTALLIFEGKDDVFILHVFLISIILDMTVITLRWPEKINISLLLDLLAFTIVFIIGYTEKKIYNKRIESIEE